MEEERPLGGGDLLTAILNFTREFNLSSSKKTEVKKGHNRRDLKNCWRARLPHLNLSFHFLLALILNSWFRGDIRLFYR